MISAHACGTLRSEATAKGISAQTFDAAMAGIEPDQSVLDAMDSQPEFKTPIWDYLAALVDEQRVADGRAKLAEWAPVLAEAEQKFGVDRHTIVAVWGVESDYGKVMGGRPLVRSLATVSCFGNRQRFFRGELRGDAAHPAKRRHAGRGADGLVGRGVRPYPVHALHVPAAGGGFRRRRPPRHRRIGARRARLHGEFPASAPAGRAASRGATKCACRQATTARRDAAPGSALAEWSRLGIRRIDGQPLAGSGPAALLLPAGASGPAFIVFRNFDAIYTYNAAESYALAIAHLSDRLRGGGPFQTAWPTDDPGLSRAERREVQELLIERGYDIGTADGAIGPRTRAAIQAFQASAGLPADGRAGQRVLKALAR